MRAFRPIACLYPIVSLEDASQGLPMPLSEAILEAGIPWLQLRCKAHGAGDQLLLARELVARAARRGTRVIVNDRLDVALASNAAGVHLGQTDLPLVLARRLVGSRRMVIGVSTHSADEARRAEQEGADYIGFGPIFATETKPDALRPRTLEALRMSRAAVHLPIVAIGGITEANAAAVLEAGADSVAMIRELRATPAPEALLRRILALRA
jgi:thiamine-phosphate pyrophosphorylase